MDMHGTGCISSNYQILSVRNISKEETRIVASLYFNILES